MPARRLLAVCCAVAALPVSACLQVHATTQSREETASRPRTIPSAKVESPSPSGFAVLPRVPGAVVREKTLPPSRDVSLAPKPDTTMASKPASVAPVAPLGSETPGLFPVGMLPPVSTPPEVPLVAAVRAYVEGRPEKAIEILRTLEKPNQEFVLALLPVMARGATADLQYDPATTSVLVDQLESVMTRLVPQAALRIDKLGFCRDVFGFGRYIPRPENEPFKPNERANLYLELKNLGSRPSDREFITHVHAAVEIRDAHNRVVEQFAPPPAEPNTRVPVVRFDRRLVTHTPLHDFHVLYSFTTPRTPGVYTITIELRDAATGRTVKSVPLQFYVAGS